MNNEVNMTEMIVIDVQDVRLIAIYNKNTSEMEVTKEILRHTTKKCIVFGDFNLPPLKPLLPHYNQVITKPSFDKGSLIDHVYTNFIISILQNSLIFTDHDMISIEYQVAK